MLVYLTDGAMAVPFLLALKNLHQGLWLVASGKPSPKTGRETQMQPERTSLGV
jgi:hypothetical protein